MNVESEFDKIQHLFLIKTSSNLGRGRNFLWLLNSVYKNQNKQTKTTKNTPERNFKRFK